jgi:hypothetical protein
VNANSYQNLSHAKIALRTMVTKGLFGVILERTPIIREQVFGSPQNLQAIPNRQGARNN